MKITNSDKFYPTLYWIVKQCLYFPYKHSLRIRFINAYYINIKHRNGIKYAETNEFGKKEKGNRVLKCKGKERQKLRKEKSKGSIKNVFLSM